MQTSAFSYSILNESSDNIYGRSKKQGRLLFAAWARRSEGVFTGLVIPNVYGPFGHPFYNSVVATFCHQIARNELPKIEIDGQLKLIYVGEVVVAIIEAIRNGDNSAEKVLAHSAEVKVSEILSFLQHFKSVYQDKGEFPVLNNSFEHMLFNTYRCYMDIPDYFPRKCVLHSDYRGAFVEIARHAIPGQTSFSTTVPGITRGNHFHTRKIERFAVIKGKARRSYSCAELEQRKFTIFTSMAMSLLMLTCPFGTPTTLKTSETKCSTLTFGSMNPSTPQTPILILKQYRTLNTQI